MSRLLPGWEREHGHGGKAGVLQQLAESELEITHILDLRFAISGRNCKRFTNMNEIELKERTKQFALRVLQLVGALPGTTEGRIIAG